MIFLLNSTANYVESVKLIRIETANIRRKFMENAFVVSNIVHPCGLVRYSINTCHERDSLINIIHVVMR